MSCTDLESLQPVPRARGRCLDAFLLGSVLALFALVLTGAALAVWAVTDLRAAMKPSTASHRVGDPPANMDSPYKVKNFAYLAANTSEAKNSTMLWKPIKYGNSSTVGSGYSYDDKNAVLTVSRAGAYFLYVQLNLTCVGRCGEGSLGVAFEADHNAVLNCSLRLQRPGPTSQHAAERCWTVIPQLSKGSRLMARMRLTSKPTDVWRVELNRSGFGIFLVD